MSAEQSSRASLFQRLAPWLLIGFALSCYYLLVDSPGTPDVPDYWVRWIGLMRQHGLIRGYAVAGSDYLPGTFTLLAAIDRMAQAIRWDVAVLLKVVIALFAIFGCAIFGFWKRSPLYSAALLLTVLFSSAAHGYLDAFYLPALLGVVWCVSVNRIFVAAFLLGLALCFKWQPILVLPFVAAFVLRRSRANTDPALVPTVLKLALGIAIPLAVQVAMFGIAPLLQSLRVATHHQALSLQGLNLNWVIQMAIHHARGLNGPLFELTPPTALAMTMKLLFVGVYAGLVVLLWLRGRSAVHFVWCALTGTFAYFALNIGVHENHVFVTTMLAFCLLDRSSPRPVLTAAYLAAALNVNLLMFYGLQGQTPLTSAHTNTAAVLLSLLNTGFFGCCLIETIVLLRPRLPKPVSTSLQEVA